MSGRFNRRRFVRNTALAAAGLVVPCEVVRAQQGKLPPSERLNIAAVGLGARGSENLKKCSGSNIVALCDVDWPLVATTLQQYPKARQYRDYRRMLDESRDLDAVVISTPDHTHAVVAAAAMKCGKHVYVEAPLAHSIGECRKLADIARAEGVTTQLGNERHSGRGIRKAVEMIWGGGLGPIREVHCWTNRPQWPQGMDRKPRAARAHAGLDWDLWLGPAPPCACHEAYHPYRWRGWLDFGTGALGAMGCHLLDVAFWGLRLDQAQSVHVQADSIGISDVSFPVASTVSYEFPARGELPPVTVRWYDGGRQPPPPSALPVGREIGSNGTIFVGEKHTMIFGPTVFGTNPGQVGPRTLPEFEEVKPVRSYQRIPVVEEHDWAKGDRHIQEWISACKAGTQPCANFEYASALTEFVLLGNVALQAGQPVSWDRRAMASVSDAADNQFIRRVYRAGWSL